MPNAQDEALVLAAVQGGLLDPERIPAARERCLSQGSGMAVALRGWLAPVEVAELLTQLAGDSYRCAGRGCSPVAFAQLLALDRLRCPSCEQPLLRVQGPAHAPPPGAGVAPPPMDATWGHSRRIGPYLLVQEIGRGSMGVVFLARREGLPRRLALKVVLAPEHDPETLARFQREAAVASRLEHPGIVGVYDVGREGRYRYYAMDYCEGKTLRELLDAGPLGPREAAELVLELARALAYAHEHQVLHRDLKPANILIDPHSGRPRVTDFGLAHDASRREALTRTGDILGTPIYMSPEQTVGQRETDGRVDVYALGVILYECLAGAPPYLEGDPQRLFRLIRAGDPLPPSKRSPGIPSSLEAICLRAMHADPERRTPQAATLALELASFLEAPPEVLLPRSRLALLGASSVALGIALALAFALGTERAPSPLGASRGPAQPPSFEPTPPPSLALAATSPFPSAPQLPLDVEAQLVRLSNASVAPFHREASAELKRDFDELRREGLGLSERYPADSRAAFLGAYLALLAKTPRDLETRRQLLRALSGSPPLPSHAYDMAVLQIWSLGFERAAADLCERGIRAEQPSAMCALNLLHVLAKAAPPVADLARAITVNEAALKRRLATHPELGDGLFVPSWDLYANLGELYLLQGRQGDAASCYERGANSTRTRTRSGLLARARELHGADSLVSTAGRNLTTKIGLTAFGAALAQLEQLENARSPRAAAEVAGKAAEELERSGELGKAVLMRVHGARLLSRAQQPIDATRTLRVAAAMALPETDGDLRALVCRALARALLSAPGGTRPAPESLVEARTLARESVALGQARPELFTRGERADAWVLLGRAELALGSEELARDAWRAAQALDPFDPRELQALGRVLDSR